MMMIIKMIMIIIIILMIIISMTILIILVTSVIIDGDDIDNDDDGPLCFVILAKCWFSKELHVHVRSVTKVWFPSWSTGTSVYHTKLSHTFSESSSGVSVES